jgi:ABC-2 type transport system ATP-binding protein
MTAVLVVDQLSKRYGARLAVDHVSFGVGAGEVMGLLGPNGSGKSTILRMLAGYLRPTSGTAHIAGFDVVTAGLQARQQVGYVPEDIPLYAHMQVREFLTFMGQLKGLRGPALRHHIAMVCDRVALSHVQHTAIGKLSRGYRQRVAIAQALLHDPPLLILDEPTNGLDPQQIIEIRQLIKVLAATRTILVTSHILSEIEKVAQRVAILLHGRLLAVHTLQENAGMPCLHLTIRGRPPERVQACLRVVPGVADVTTAEEADGDIMSYRVRVASLEVTEMLTATLIAHGFGVRQVREARADLEAVFLQLTSARGVA